MPKKLKLTPHEYGSKVTAKLREMVGSPEWNESEGKFSFLNNTWKTKEQREQFVNWLSSEFQRDKDFYAAFQYHGHRNNTKKNSDQLASLWECDKGPRFPVC